MNSVSQAAIVPELPSRIDLQALTGSASGVLAAVLVANPLCSAAISLRQQTDLRE